jgi:hypothetical protein
LVAEAARAGLSYSQHVVLLHVPILGNRLAAPPDGGGPSPFRQVHTDVFVFTAVPGPNPRTVRPRRYPVVADVPDRDDHDDRDDQDDRDDGQGACQPGRVEHACVGVGE